MTRELDASLISSFPNAAAVSIGLLVVALLVLWTLSLLAFRLLRSVQKNEEQAATEGFVRAVIDKLTGQDAGAAWPLALREAVRDYLDARNAFWEVFVGVVLAIFVVLVLTVLLVFGVISPEAGLPMLAAVISYVLGRGSAKSNSISNIAGPPRESGEERGRR